MNVDSPRDGLGGPGSRAETWKHAASRRPGPSRSPTRGYSDSASLFATRTDWRSPTSIAKMSRDGGRRPSCSPATNIRQTAGLLRKRPSTTLARDALELLKLLGLRIKAQQAKMGGWLWLPKYKRLSFRRDCIGIAH